MTKTPIGGSGCTPGGPQFTPVTATKPDIVLDEGLGGVEEKSGGDKLNEQVNLPSSSPSTGTLKMAFAALRAVCTHKSIAANQ